MLGLIQEDYQNILKLLERVGIQGLSEARYVAVLAAKIEATIQQNAQHAASLVPPPAAPPAPVPPLLAPLPPPPGAPAPADPVHPLD
jgi:hypothetical protein